MVNLKFPIIVLVVVVGVYLVSIGTNFSDKDMSIKSWEGTLDRWISISQASVQPGELTLLRNTGLGCRLSAKNKVPILIMNKNVLCSLLISASEERIRQLTIGSTNKVKVSFSGKKGADGEPSSMPFNNKTLNEISLPLDIMRGGGALTLECEEKNMQCKVQLG